MKSILILIVLTGVSIQVHSDAGAFQFEFAEIGPGVWSGVRADSPRFPVMGNTTFVISSVGVVVFDGGGMPAMSEQVIAKIRSLTDQPVTHVVISHWHGDHNFGVYRFAQEFPNVQFIAHPFTNEVFNSTRIKYVDGQGTYIENNLESFHNIVETGVDAQGNAVSEADRIDYARIIADAPVLQLEFNRAKLTPANITFTHKYVIQSGLRTIELLHLGQGNTAGDIVMWLPEERIVAAGDLVVRPSPYAFNVPPRAWAKTLRALNELDYKILVPGHGEVLSDTTYVDLLIEAAESIANQRDTMLAKGMTRAEVEVALDFSAFEQRFTHGDAYIQNYYEAYFETPFRAAAMAVLGDEPMVKIDPPELIPFADERWQIDAAEAQVVEYQGHQALKLRGGTAVLPELDVNNALVEFDIAVSQVRGFAGLVFRLQDQANYEHFYLRPHQSANPDANQYTPVFNGVAGWQLYHGEGYGTPVDYRFDQWMHVKVIFAGTQAQVYIDSDKPVLHIKDLKRRDFGGAIGVQAADLSSVHFANFKMTVLADAYAFAASGKQSSDSIEDVVSSWLVSDAFDGKSVRGASILNDTFKSSLTWTQLQAEKTGITNLARVQGRSKGKDTVIARLVVSADKAKVQDFAFGYSDVAQVYLNDKLVYTGNNTYRSRDYRYLGTIGLFDHLSLPLKEGANEIWIAVTEAFGGWGVMAQYEGE